MLFDKPRAFFVFGPRQLGYCYTFFVNEEVRGLINTPRAFFVLAIIYREIAVSCLQIAGRSLRGEHERASPAEAAARAALDSRK